MPPVNPHICHAFSNDCLGNDDATALQEQLAKGKISKRELIEATIKRAEKVEPTLNAIRDKRFQLTTLPKAPRQSKAYFDGIPSFIKDNIPVAGLANGFGSGAVPHRIEKRHDPFAKQYLSMGFELLGKSSLPEFGFNATTEPENDAPTPNPWHISYSAGASSGGAAALVASGVVPIAHGNDGGGSIRIPAACCGLVGLKPSRNRHINSLAAKALPINIVSEGVLTRSVRDSARYHFEAQKYYRNKRLPILPMVTEPARKRLKIGVIMNAPGGPETDEALQASVLETARVLQAQGHTLKEIPFPVPQAFGDDFALYWAMMAFLVKHTGKAAFGSKFEPARLDGLSHGLANYYAKRALFTPATLVRLKRYQKAILAPFKHYDAILSPVLRQQTPMLGHLSPQQDFESLFENLRSYIGFTPLANVSGGPAISLPSGLSSSGLPLSIQLMADLGGEQSLLELAYELEREQPWQDLWQSNVS